MENTPDNLSGAVTVLEFRAAIFELSYDLVRAQRGAVRAALADAAAEIGSERAAAIAAAILVETEARFCVAAGATLIAIGGTPAGG